MSTVAPFPGNETTKFPGIFHRPLGGGSGRSVQTIVAGQPPRRGARPSRRPTVTNGARTASLDSIG